MAADRKTETKVVLRLPFYLQLEKEYRVPYEKICGKQLDELISSDVEISFSEYSSRFGRPNTVITIRLESPHKLNKSQIDFFVHNDFLLIVNRVILAFQAATESWQNAGFINPIGLTEIQLNAEISVNGKELRDRKPRPFFTNFPLLAEEEKDFEDYLRGSKIPLPKHLITNAILLLEQGQYTLSVLQAAVAVELHLTEEIVGKLKGKMTEEEIDKYRRRTLGRKLAYSPSDDRSPEKYWSNIKGLSKTYRKLNDDLRPLRNDIAHRGHTSSRKEAVGAVGLARAFLKLIP